MTTNVPPLPDPNDYVVPATGNVCWEDYRAAVGEWALAAGWTPPQESEDTESPANPLKGG